MMLTAVASSSDAMATSSHSLLYIIGYMFLTYCGIMFPSSSISPDTLYQFIALLALSMDLSNDASIIYHLDFTLPATILLGLLYVSIVMTLTKFTSRCRNGFPELKDILTFAVVLGLAIECMGSALTVDQAATLVHLFLLAKMLVISFIRSITRSFRQSKMRFFVSSCFLLVLVWAAISNGRAAEELFVSVKSLFLEHVCSSLPPQEPLFEHLTMTRLVAQAPPSTWLNAVRSFVGMEVPEDYIEETFVKSIPVTLTCGQRVGEVLQLDSFDYTRVISYVRLAIDASPFVKTFLAATISQGVDRFNDLLSEGIIGLLNSMKSLVLSWVRKPFNAVTQFATHKTELFTKSVSNLTTTISASVVDSKIFVVYKISIAIDRTVEFWLSNTCYGIFPVRLLALIIPLAGFHCYLQGRKLAAAPVPQKLALLCEWHTQLCDASYYVALGFNPYIASLFRTLFRREVSVAKATGVFVSSAIMLRALFLYSPRLYWVLLVSLPVALLAYFLALPIRLEELSKENERKDKKLREYEEDAKKTDWDAHKHNVLEYLGPDDLDRPDFIAEVEAHSPDSVGRWMFAAKRLCQMLFASEGPGGLVKRLEANHESKDKEMDEHKLQSQLEKNELTSELQRKEENCRNNHGLPPDVREIQGKLDKSNDELKKFKNENAKLKHDLMTVKDIAVENAKDVIKVNDANSKLNEEVKQLKLAKMEPSLEEIRAFILAGYTYLEGHDEAQDNIREIFKAECERFQKEYQESMKEVAEVNEEGDEETFLPDFDLSGHFYADEDMLKKIYLVVVKEAILRNGFRVCYSDRKKYLATCRWIEQILPDWQSVNKWEEKKLDELQNLDNQAIQNLRRMVTPVLVADAESELAKSDTSDDRAWYRAWLKFLSDELTWTF